MKPRVLLALVLAAALSSGSAAANECLTGEVAFSDSVLEATISKLGDETIDAAGKKALLQLYRNARANLPQWPVGNVDTAFTTRDGSKLMRHSPFATLLRNMSDVRDGLLAPLEAMDAGDTEGVKAALSGFVADKVMETATAAALGEGPGAFLHGAIKVYLASVEELEKQECLLAIDLEYYEVTMGDAKLSPANKERVDYYVRNYLLGGGLAPSGLERDVHRARTQCYLDAETSEALAATRFTAAPLGVRTPFDAFVDATQGSLCLGTTRRDNSCRAAVGAMLHDFDVRKKIEDARKTLRQARQAPAYETLWQAVSRIADPAKVASNLCAAYQAALAEEGPAPGPGPGAEPGGESAAAEHLGCFADNRSADPTGTDGRDLDGAAWNSSQMTVRACAKACAEQGFAFAGVQFGSWCFCGNAYNRFPGGAAACDMTCSGNAGETCGGVWANDVWRVRQ